MIKKYKFYRIHEKEDETTTTGRLVEELDTEGEYERLGNSTIETNHTKAGNNTFVAAVEEAVEDVMDAAKGAADHVKNLFNKHVLGDESKEDVESEDEDEDESEEKVEGTKRKSRSSDSQDPKFVLRETNQKKVHKVVREGEENVSEENESSESVEQDHNSRESAEAGESTTVTEAETTTAETQFRDSTTQNPTAQKDDVIPTGGFVAESSEAAKEDNKSKLPSTQAEIKNKN